MNSVIEVTAKSVYGRVMLYPANDQAERLAEIVGTRTLTVNTLQTARAMGFTVKVTGETLSIPGVTDR